MEYAKDIILEVKDGQVVRNKKRNIITRIAKGISNHKMITTIVMATISFIVIDLLLISSFVSVLMQI